MPEEYELNENLSKVQDIFQINGNLFTSLYQKIHESPEILADFTQIYNNKQDSGEGKKRLRTKRSDENHKQVIQEQGKNYYEGLIVDNHNDS